MTSLRFALFPIVSIFLGCSHGKTEWDPTYEELTSNEGAFSARQVGIQPAELLPLVNRAAEGDRDALLKIQLIAPLGDGASSLMDRMLLAKILEDSGDLAYSNVLARQPKEVRAAHSKVPDIEKFPLTYATVNDAVQAAP